MCVLNKVARSPLLLSFYTGQKKIDCFGHRFYFLMQNSTLKHSHLNGGYVQVFQTFLSAQKYCASCDFVHFILFLGLAIPF